MNYINYFIRFCIILTIIILVFFAGLIIKDISDREYYEKANTAEVNICEEYANAEHIRIDYPSKVYNFNNITISELELKEACNK